MSNGYIQIDIGGKLRGLKFGMLAVESLVQEGLKRGTEVSETKTVYDLVYHGLLNNCEAKRVNPDFSYENVMDWVDEKSGSEDGKQELLTVTETFIKSRALQIMTDEAVVAIGGELSKKK